MKSKLQTKKKVLDSIKKGLKEVMDSKKNGIKLQSLSDFLKELDNEKQ